MTAFVRVKVMADGTCCDLVVPAAVPMAEVVPDLLRGVGLLDAACVHEGCRIETAAGRRLGWETGLDQQGVVGDTVLVIRRRLVDEQSSGYDTVLPSAHRRRSPLRALRRLRWPATTRPG